MLIYKILGFVFVGLGAIGIFLPLLPTTPFLLVAAACFAKSSDKWHKWLLSNRVFGPVIINWQENRCISLRTKIVAVSLIVLFGGISILFLLNDYTLKIICSILLLTGLFFVIRIKVCKKGKKPG